MALHCDGRLLETGSVAQRRASPLEGRMTMRRPIGEQSVGVREPDQPEPSSNLQGFPVTMQAQPQ